MNFQKILSGLVLSAGLVGCASGGDRAPSAATRGDHYLSNANGEVHNKAVSENHCGQAGGGGEAQLIKKDGRTWTLTVKNMGCSRFKVDGPADYSGEMDGEKDRGRSVEVNVSVPGQYDVYVGSKSFVNSSGMEGEGSVFHVTTVAENRPSYETLNLQNRNGESPRVYLKNCKGSVYAEIDNGTVNVKFTDVRDCNQWDILAENGDNANYGAKTFPKGNDSPSYAVPKRYVEWGSNAVMVSVSNGKSGRDRLEDRLILSFRGGF